MHAWIEGWLPYYLSKNEEDISFPILNVKQKTLKIFIVSEAESRETPVENNQYSAKKIMISHLSLIR